MTAAGPVPIRRPCRTGPFVRVGAQAVGYTERSYAPETAMVAGVLLIAWIIVQLLVLQGLQLVAAAMALAGAGVFFTGVLVRAWAVPRL